jgi:hypothetical protein
MQPICVLCKKELVCKKNGVVVRWRAHWCRVADEYMCPSCGAGVLVFSAGAEGYEDTSDAPKKFEMPDEYGPV